VVRQFAYVLGVRERDFIDSMINYRFNTWGLYLLIYSQRVLEFLETAIELDSELEMEFES